MCFHIYSVSFLSKVEVRGRGLAQMTRLLREGRGERIGEEVFCARMGEEFLGDPVPERSHL